MAKRIKTVLLFGPPAAQGTQGRLLGVLPGFVHVACGEVFRSLDTNSEVGKVFLYHSSRANLCRMIYGAILARAPRETREDGQLQADSDTLVLDGIQQRAPGRDARE